MTEIIARYGAAPPVTAGEHLQAIRHEIETVPDIEASTRMEDLIYSTHVLLQAVARVKRLVAHYDEMIGRV